MILRWLGRENKENVARTRNCCGWPSFPSCNPQMGNPVYKSYNFLARMVKNPAVKVLLLVCVIIWKKSNQQQRYVLNIIFLIKTQNIFVNMVIYDISDKILIFTFEILQTVRQRVYRFTRLCRIFNKKFIENFKSLSSAMISHSLKGTHTVVNLTLPCLPRRSLKFTLTVPLNA